MDFDPLSPRQAPGCKESDLEQGEENPGSRRHPVERPQGQDTGCIQSTTTRIQSATASKDLYPQEKRQDEAVEYSHDVRQGDAGFIQACTCACGRDYGRP